VISAQKTLLLALALILLTACGTASPTTGAASPTLQASRTPRQVDSFAEPATPVPSASPSPLSQRGERPVHFNMLVGGEPGQYLYRAEFQTPTGMALGPDGNIYVADFLGRRVVSIAPDGTVTDLELWRDPTLWVSDGPRDVGFDSQGRLHISDSSALYRVSADGALEQIAEVDAGGPLDEFAFGPADQLYFVVRGQGRVFRLLEEGLAAEIANDLLNPYGIVVGQEGGLFVSERGRERVVQIELANQKVSEFFSGYLLQDPIFLAFDSEGDLWVRGAFSLYQLSAEGALKPFTIDGVPYSRDNNSQLVFLRTPGGIAFDQAGRLWIGTYNSQILRLDPIAADAFELVQVNAGLEASDLAVTPDGAVYVYNENLRQLWRLREPGVVEVLLEGDRPGRAGLAADPQGNVYVGLPSGEIQKLAPDGSFSHFANLAARRMVVGGDGNLYAQVGDYGQPRRVVRISGVDQVSPFVSNVNGQIFSGAGIGEIILARAEGGLYVADTANGHIYYLDFEGRGELVAEVGGESGTAALASSADGDVFAFAGYWLTQIRPDGSRVELALLQGDPWAMGLSPDGRWLYVAESGAIDMIPLQP